MEGMHKSIENNKQNLKYFHIFTAVYIASILTSITVSARIFPFTIPLTNFSVLLTGGTWTIPITFFVQDITTEVYGYTKSKQLVLLGVPIVVFYILYLKLTTFFPIPNQQNIDVSYNIVFNALPRHLFALLAAVALGNLVNNYLLSKLKKYFHGKYLPIRFIGSTAVGEAALQLVGTTVAWFGSLGFTKEILPFILFSYFYKVAFEAIMTPINVLVCHWLKKAESIDVYES
jgi:uncharacterized integral membrane protein (TIGR00697 family)